MSNNGLDNFDKLIQEKLNSQIHPIDHSVWNNLEKKLPKSNTSIFSKRWFWAAATFIIAVAISLILPHNTQTNTNKTYISSNNNIDLLIPTQIDYKTSEIEINSNKPKTQELIAENFKSAEIAIAKTDSETESSSDARHNEKTTETIAKVSNEGIDSSLPIDPSVEPSINFSMPADIIELNKAIINIDKNSGCAGSTFDFSTEYQENVDFLWSFGDETYSSKQNPSHTYNVPGDYKISLIIRSIIDNSVLSKANDILVNILELPTTDFEYELEVINGITQIEFINTTEIGQNWSWDLSNGNISNEKDPVMSYKRKGEYPITLHAENSEGCHASKTKMISILEDYNLLAPNSFTPNNDGINDLFIPEALKFENHQFSMSIFSKTEGLIYETKNADSPWDGINRQTGNKCSQGHYIWIVNMINSEGQSEQYKGAVLLLD